MSRTQNPPRRLCLQGPLQPAHTGGASAQPLLGAPLGPRTRPAEVEGVLPPPALRYASLGNELNYMIRLPSIDVPLVTNLCVTGSTGTLPDARRWALGAGLDRLSL